ncbi:unnamed protein product [Umbelopsis vinacea]
MQQEEQQPPDDKTYDSIRFGDFKSYMERKKRKLKDQEQLILASTTETSQIFKGLVIYVNGYTRPSHSDLRKIITAHGGDFQHYLSKSRVTHIVASNLTNAKIEEFRLYKVVQPEWIMDSVEAGKLLSWQNYRLNSPVEVHQKEISFQNQGKSTKTQGTSSVPHPIEVERDKISNTASVDTAREEVHEDEKIPFTTLPKSPKGKQASLPIYVEGRTQKHSHKAENPTEQSEPKAENIKKRENKDHVAVCHSKGLTETSSGAVASCNYEARKYGVCNGTIVGHARKLCPGLEVIPYEFDKYKEVSEIFYEILFKYADELEPVSVDEALIDVTSSITDFMTEESLATKIRAQIKEMTGCDASIGCGSNILLARTNSNAIHSQTGYAMADKMKSMNIETIGDLRRYQMRKLQDTFGKKTGETLYKFARGIDDRPLSVGQPRQSVSAEVSWGVRFENNEQVDDFVLGLSKEIKRRRLDAMEAEKHMGHGICDSFSKSISLERHTDDALLIFEEAIKLLKSHHFDAADIRGLGIQIQKLDNDIGGNPIEEDGQSVLPFKMANKGQQEVISKPAVMNVDTVLPTKREGSRFQASTSTSSPRKPPMEVEKQAFMELPVDIRNELERLYELVFLDEAQDQEPKLPSDDILIVTADESRIEMPQDIANNNKNIPDRSNNDAVDEQSSQVSQTLEPKGTSHDHTQLELPPWSQLNPRDLLAMPDSMRAQVLQDYSEQDKTAPNKKRKDSPSKTLRSPKRSKPKRTAGQKTPTFQANTKRGDDQNMDSGGKRTFTLTQMFPPQSPSKRLSTRNVLEELPDWDPNVLSELPADIRAELLDDHRRQREQKQKDLQNKLDNAKALASATRSHSVTSVPIARPALMGQTDISSIRDLLHAWVSAFVSEPEADDVETVSKYLMQLARVRDFHQAQLVVQYLTMLINRTVSQSPSSSESVNVGQGWKLHIEKLRNRLDHEVYKLYQCKLKWST